VKMANRAEADSAKSALRGCKIKGQPRPIRIKFANQGTSIEVKNISPMISNERLYDGFARFGKIERAVVLVDEKGKSLERGIIEFDRKASASRAIEQVNNGCFFLTKSPRAIVCSPVEAEDADDGLREEQLYHIRGFEEEYSHPPRFAAPETFEMDFGNRWKALEELDRSQLEQNKNESQERKRRLEQEMDIGLAAEQERLIKMEMERQQSELKRMQENRMHQQNQLRNRHDAEMEQSNRHRQNMNEQHQRLRELVDGRDMKPANEYKPPPNWQPPQNRMQGGGDQWGRSGMDQDRRRSGPGGFGGHGGPGGPGGRPGFDDGFGDRGGFNRSYDGGNQNGGFNDFNGGHHNGGGFNNSFDQDNRGAGGYNRGGGHGGRGGGHGGGPDRHTRGRPY